MLKRTIDWVAEGTGARLIWRTLARHPVPPGTADRKKGWMYVLGMATFTAFVAQLVTGIALTSRYIPSQNQAYHNLVYLTDAVPWGAVVRGMHYYGGSVMLVLVVLHVGRVFLTGSYKFPRELNWISGVALLFLTLGALFTGPILRWDRAGIEMVEAAGSFLASLPVVGGWLHALLDDGGTGDRTLLRIYAAHVLLIPLLILAGVALHLYLVQIHGISEPPDEEQPVRAEEYRGRYARHLAEGKALYVPDTAWREAVAGMGTLGAILLLAVVLGPKGPGEPVGSSTAPTSAERDWFLLWYDGLTAMTPTGAAPTLLLTIGFAALLILTFLPIAFSEGQRHPRRRPWAIAVLVLAVAGTFLLSWLGWHAASP